MVRHDAQDIVTYHVMEHVWLTLLLIYWWSG
jgi:hypothetical protein